MRLILKSIKSLKELRKFQIHFDLIEGIKRVSRLS